MLAEPLQLTDEEGHVPDVRAVGIRIRDTDTHYFSASIVRASRFRPCVPLRSG